MQMQENVQKFSAAWQQKGRQFDADTAVGYVAGVNIHHSESLAQSVECLREHSCSRR